MATISLVVDGDTPASVALNSVVRLDTEAEVLVTPPVAMVLAGGAWSYTFDEPAAGLTYRYEYAITWDDDSIYEGQGTVDGAATADGYYPERAQVLAGMGETNFNVGSNLDNETADTPNETYLQQAFAKADALVDGFAIVARLTADADATSPHYIGPANAIWTSLRTWASELAGVLVHRLRGVVGREDGQSVEGQLTVKYDQAVAEIKALLAQAYQTQLAAADGSFGYGAEVIDAPCGCYPPDVQRPICGGC